MTNFKKIFILYIYRCKEILRLIKTQKDHSRLAAKENIAVKRPHHNWLGGLILKAFIISFLIFFTIIYYHQGASFFFVSGISLLNEVVAFELFFTFIFILFTFISHRGISNFLNNRNLFQDSSIIRKLVEAILVVINSTILLFLFILVPFLLAFPEIEVLPERHRFNIAFMAILSLFFYYFVERERSKRNLQEKILLSTRLQKETFQAQLEGLKNQINPHFLFNSLNVLRSLITYNKAQAKEFVTRLSTVYRSLLVHSEKKLVSLEQEMKLTEAYIYLLNTRFGPNLRFDIDIEKEHLDLLLPPGSLQMLIENAVKHNGSTRKNPLSISIISKNKSLVIKNNLQPRLDSIESTKTGLQNIRRRYELLSAREIELKPTEKEFCVLLPLLEK
ncbi:sensor histidine kinase [Salinimicrobium sp. CAU 1759]